VRIDDDLTGNHSGIDYSRYLTVDFQQTGVGGIDSWSRQAYPMAPYRVAADKPYAYSFRLRPIERR
jgi:hypothetical protein